jgi:hypothetical protein
MSQAVLMKEYKDLSKEKWLQIEVSAWRALFLEVQQQLTFCSSMRTTSTAGILP